MYHQVFAPVADSLTASALIASLPLVTVFVLLGVLRLKAPVAALSALAVALAVSVVGYGMPLDQALLSASEGSAFGVFPILWIVVNAIWIYQLTVRTGHFDVLRRSFGAISDDPRIQAIIIAFCFGALLEALAGFGAPVAITAVMLIALGFDKIKAATVVLVANTAPVAFGALAIPIITAAKLTGIPSDELGATVGRQTPVLALFVPLLLVALVDGRRGLREARVPALVCGASFAVTQFACSNYLSVELTDIVASLVSVLALVTLLRVWQPVRPGGATPSGSDDRLGAAVGAPAGPQLAPQGGRQAGPHAATEVRTEVPAEIGTRNESRVEVVRAYAPYATIIAVFALAQLGAVKSLLERATVTFGWPGLDVVAPNGALLASTTFTLNLASAGGTLLLLSGLVTAAVLKASPRVAVETYGQTLYQLRSAIVTVMAVLALAYVMNQSGQTTTLGLWIAGAGGLFAFLSPVLGWLGVAVTGSDTSSNALFATLQVTAANRAGIDPTLLAAANASGGVVGKMISPQTLTIACAAAGLHGEEGTLFRKVLGYSLGMLLVVCVLVYLQSTPVLGWMIP
jgi:lactate permease